MRKIILSIAVAGAIALGFIAPAPAFAVVQSTQHSSHAFLDDPVATLNSIVGSALWTPVILSTMASSLFGSSATSLTLAVAN
ncbi:hypothetical protein CSTAT_11140 [Corynebacterium stationis]|uniref:hypothetical protein n=1 Tax=Corynebacterium stationis TaxID=1705 RepID=UPI0009509027|nr:hypothetical protein [Corynebacterium stationis]APT95804.1 hypothetical protein CSTAT_11140 [Corynebacterium stationis]